MFKFSRLPHLSTSILLLHRANSVRLVFLLFLLILFIVILAAQFSGRHPATISLDVGISIIKIMIPLLFSIFTQELIVKEFERKSFLQSLAYPHDRINFFLNRWLAGMVFVLVFYVISACLLLGSVAFISTGYDQSTQVSLGGNYWVVILVNLIDVLVISAVAALLGVVAKSPGFVLIGTVGFTVVARSYGSILQLLSGDMLVVDDPEKYQGGLRLLTFAVPDLGALDIRQIALYNDLGLLPSGLIHSVIASIIYAVAILSLASYLFKIKSVA